MNALSQQLPSVALDLFKLCVWLVLLTAIFVPLELLFPARRRRILRRGFWSDIGYYFLNNYLAPILMIPPIALLGWALHFLVPAQVYAFSGSLPLWVRVGAGLVLGEATYYWSHRWMHETPFLWRFHAVHHAPEEVDWLTSTHAHPLDIAFGHFFGLIPLYALGLTQSAGESTDLAPLIFVIVGRIWGFFIHANLNWRFGWLERMISTPAFHHWHHTRSDHVDRNYSTLLPIMDIVFGTYYLPRHLPEDYGVRDPIAADMTGQLLDPFGPPKKPVSVQR